MSSCCCGGGTEPDTSNRIGPVAPIPIALTRCSENGKLTVYLSQRDFAEYATHVDSIDGVIHVDPAHLKGRIVSGHIQARYYHATEDLEVRKTLVTKQIFPWRIYDDDKEGHCQRTKASAQMQRRLMNRLGGCAAPFQFKFPAHSPPSVSLERVTCGDDRRKPCGVEYELLAYIEEPAGVDPDKEDYVRIPIRKITCAPDKSPPNKEISKEFTLALEKLWMRVSLDKGYYCHGEPILISVDIQNLSNREVERSKVSIRQQCQILNSPRGVYHVTIAEEWDREEHPILPCTSASKVYKITPSLFRTRRRKVIALDGNINDPDTKLASSTLEPPPEVNDQAILRVKVDYKVKVKLVLVPAFSSGEVAVELPFLIGYPPPPPHSENEVEVDDGGDAVIFEDF